MVRRLYGLDVLKPLLIRPVVALADEAGRSEILSAVTRGDPTFVYFQDILGGEISLSKTAASPELSFDITVVELLPGSATLSGKFSEAALRAGNTASSSFRRLTLTGPMVTPSPRYQVPWTCTETASPSSSPASRTGPDGGLKGPTFRTSSSEPSTRLPSSFRSPSATPRSLRACHTPARLGLLAAVPRRSGSARTARGYVAAA